ncbi:MAG: hypothetical protein ACHQ02_01210 [Candidatus Limnocylindrales bacterium]|jgi:hypothetical protein
MANRVAAPPASKRPDPWFDLEGKAVRRGRRTRMTVELIAFAVVLAILLAAIFVRLYL